jgi:uncharacterized protein YndB with AHSA1/START domain
MVVDQVPGSRWEHQRLDDARNVDMVGKVIESTPPRRMVLTWVRPKDAEDDSKHSRVTFNIEPHGDGLIRVTVTHEASSATPMLAVISSGWPKVLSNLKTLLETGRALPHSPSST